MNRDEGDKGDEEKESLKSPSSLLFGLDILLNSLLFVPIPSIPFIPVI
jgi:hypothetical protein